MKIVRDRIPELFPEHSYRLVRDQEEHILLLRLKLAEEVGELLSAPTKEALIEEIIDVRHVLATLARLCDVSVEDLERVGLDKIRARGAFLDGQVLQ